MNKIQRKKYKSMSLRRLRNLRDELDAIISELDALPHLREIDIAIEHSGNVSLIHEVVAIKGTKESGRWRQQESIYCSQERCPRCPHGPHWYRYRANKKRKSVTATFEGTPVFDHKMLLEMLKKARPPIFVGPIKEVNTWIDQRKTGRHEKRGHSHPTLGPKIKRGPTQKDPD